MDESTRDFQFWVALIAGLFLAYSGVSALITGTAYYGRDMRQHLEGQDAVTYGWAVDVGGAVLLLVALLHFLGNRRR